MPSKKTKKEEKFTRVKQLKCYERVHDMLCYGYPATSVAKFIKSQGEYRTAKFGSLVSILKRYRKAEIIPVDVLARRRPDIVVNAQETYTDKLGELRQLDMMIQSTYHRYDRESAIEMDTGVYNPAVDRIAKELRDLIKTMHTIKMDLGISGQRQIGTLHVSAERLEEIRQKHGEGAMKVMADPVSRARVYAYLKAVEDAAILKAKEDERAKLLKDGVGKAVEVVERKRRRDGDEE